MTLPFPGEPTPDNLKRYGQAMKRFKQPVQDSFIKRTIEELSDIEHQRWADWQRYFFDRCQLKPMSEVGGMDDRYVYFSLLKYDYERWTKQINTDYKDLTEEEKQKDRDQVERYLPIISKALQDQRTELIKEVRYRLPEYENKENDIVRDSGELNNYIRGSWMGFNTCLEEVYKILDNLK